MPILAAEWLNWRARLSPRAGGLEGDLDVTGTGHSLGDVDVTGDIRLLGATDCAEQFEVAGVAAEPGTVIVIDDRGALRPSEEPYDRRVAGVVSGAESHRAGIVLDSGPADCERVAIALLGKTHCKVGATYGQIVVGDLLTSSPTRGHAMKAAEPTRAFGAAIGKALGPITTRLGLIPILIALQ